MDHLAEFAARRQKISDQMVDNSIAFIAAAATQYRNSDTEYPFRQDSYFHYVTGFNESFAIAILLKKQGKVKYILFCQDNDSVAERWTGERVGLKNACEKYGADAAYSITDTALRLPDLFVDLGTLYYLVNNNPAFDKKLFSWLESLRKRGRQANVIPHKFIDLRVILDECRLIKSEQELSYIRKVCDISAQAHVKAMQRCQVGMHEYELEAVLLHEFYRQGCRNVAYPSIVAAGNNACTLHYTRNAAKIIDGDLILIDAGGEIAYYAADITRTFPANGKFSEAQQIIYELVLASQMAAIAKVAPGVAWDEIQRTILEILVQGLVELKILRGDVKTLLDEKAYLPFYMHNSGHWLGLDVHDVGEYKSAQQTRKLIPGMVFTIEPGLYFDRNMPHIAEKWQGIGVRIEDDILVTAQGCEVLTEGVPKTVNAIESLMAKAQRK